VSSLTPGPNGSSAVTVASRAGSGGEMAEAMDWKMSRAPGGRSVAEGEEERMLGGPFDGEVEGEDEGEE
jgi:hypothetical protein